MGFILLKEREDFSIKVNQNSVRVSEMTLFHKAAHLCVGTLSSATTGTYWPLTDMFQIIQYWYFQDFNGLCLTEGQQDRLLTLNFLAPLSEGGREARETSSGLSVKTKWNTQKLQLKVDCLSVNSFSMNWSP